MPGRSIVSRDLHALDTGKAMNLEHPFGDLGLERFA
jgi:hypothetical protein